LPPSGSPLARASTSGPTAACTPEAGGTGQSTAWERTPGRAGHPTMVRVPPSPPHAAHEVADGARLRRLHLGVVLLPGDTGDQHCGGAAGCSTLFWRGGAAAACSMLLWLDRGALGGYPALVATSTPPKPRGGAAGVVTASLALKPHPLKAAHAAASS
jgi:hypothetical protein